MTPQIEISFKLFFIIIFIELLHQDVDLSFSSGDQGFIDSKCHDNVSLFDDDIVVSSPTDVYSDLPHPNHLMKNKVSLC